MKKFLPIVLFMSACSLTAFAGPYISASPNSLNSLSYITGAGPSVAQTASVYSPFMALTSGNVTVTAPADFEISINNTSFGSTLSLPYSGDTMPNTLVYVRMKGGLAAGSYSNEMLHFVATGVADSIALNGMVSSGCTIAPGAITATSASFTWNATGAASYECIVDQTATPPTIAGTPVATASYTISTLTASTNYYFHVRGKSSTGSFTQWTMRAFSTKPTGINSIPKNDLSILLAPNPNNGHFTITGSLTSAKEVLVMVVNATGQLVYSSHLAPAGSSFDQTINLAGNIPAGMYFVRIAAGNQTNITRFTIVK